MQQYRFPSDVAENTADFTKAEHILNKDFLAAKREFKKSSKTNQKRLFLNYCLAVINQWNDGNLTIREAAYIIGNCEGETLLEDPGARSIIKEASNLQRHPDNFREDHAKGWDHLVKNISALRKKVR